METFYIVIVVILFLLAISDLIVGVSNDAVNFLNSAIGSKAASFKLVMIIAAIGILIGTTFSSGMMEVARKGIFHPEKFAFNEIIFIFLAVMLTDIILLDVYNTLGLPTSTTVSIVFELLGAAVGIAFIKVNNIRELLVNNPSSLNMSQEQLQNVNSVSDFINTGKAMEIVGGILLAVVVAFTAGAIIQYIVRVVFSFNLHKTYKYFGSIWGGMAIAIITYFLLIKGAKGSSWLSKENIHYIQTHTATILLICFVGWTVILQLLIWIAKVNVLKIIVLAGTFALAMAFAGNDLVNFIGVPLAGLESFKLYQAGGLSDSLLMDGLTQKVNTPTLYLLIAGAIMVVTLWFSKKAKSVIKTSVDLSKQGETDERFASSTLSQAVVRFSIGINNAFTYIIPKPILKKLDSRFNKDEAPKHKKKDAPAFDMLRASVNLVVASILISIGTSKKIPLSTTYVTFMVAMGTSLADRAWGRESAVYRISGVLTVIGGWFITAFSAFTVAFLIASAIYWGKAPVIIALVALVIFLVIRNQFTHKKKVETEKEEVQEDVDIELSGENVYEKCHIKVIENISIASDIYSNLVSGLISEKRKKLKKNHKHAKSIGKETKLLIDNSYKIIKRLKEEFIETGHSYTQVLNYMRELFNSLNYISKPTWSYVENNHPSLLPSQHDDLKELDNELQQFFKLANKILVKRNYKRNKDILKMQVQIIDTINRVHKEQIKMLKNEKISTRNSMLILNILHETENIIQHIGNILLAQKDFSTFNEKKNF